MLIQIARPLRLGIFDTEVQTFRVGEIYRVAPAIGTVLVSEGWAREVDAGGGSDGAALECANDDPCDEYSGS